VVLSAGLGGSAFPHPRRASFFPLNSGARRSGPPVNSHPPLDRKPIKARSDALQILTQTVELRFMATDKLLKIFVIDELPPFQRRFEKAGQSGVHRS
jgi:hypothetical protein